MDGVTLLRQARQAGLRVRADGDRLAVEGPRRLEPLARTILAEKPRVLAALVDEEREVAWRIAAMRPQVPASGPIPLLIARAVAVQPAKACCSCGDPLEPDDRYRCQPCARAVVSVLLERR